MLAFTIHGKIRKNHTKALNLQHQIRHGMKSLNYMKDHILYQILKTDLNILSKNIKN